MPRILRAREIGDGVIGGFFEQKIAVGAEKGQAAAQPRFLVLPVAVFRARLQRRLGVEKKIEAGRASARLGAERRIIGLGRLQIFRRQLFVPGRHRPGRGALEHRERGSLLRDDRNRLDRRGAGTDDADAQAGEVDTLMRPFAGVIDRSAKILETLKIRTVRRRQAADRHDAELRTHSIAAVGLDLPAICVFIERRRGHARVEHDMPAKIEAIGDMVGVGEDFALAARTSPTSSTPGPAPPRRRTSTACSRRRNARPDTGSSTRCRRRRRRPRTPVPKSQARAGDAACTSRQSPRRPRRRRKPFQLQQGVPVGSWRRQSWFVLSLGWSRRSGVFRRVAGMKQKSIMISARNHRSSLAARGARAIKPFD